MNKKSFHMEYGIWFFVALSALYFLLWHTRFGGNDIYGDGKLYYEYFVRIFITHNFVGSELIKYPIGTCLLQLPFLLISWMLSVILGKDLEGGYSPYFQRGVYASAVFYFLLAMIILYYLLRKKYSPAASLITCICLSYGTMLIEYTMRNCSYSHMYGFFICTTFFSYIAYYEEKVDRQSPRMKLFMNLLLGSILGISFIVRNTNIIIGATYLFYDVGSVKEFGTRLKQRIFRPVLAVQILSFAIIYIFQMLFWRLQAGNWVLYSYGNESFDYAMNPQIMSVLFSDAKGLFIFCPVLILSFIGMIFYRKENKEYRIAQWVIFIGVTYLISAWGCWWLGYGYGERMYCDILCVCALPMAALFEHLIAYTKILNEKKHMCWQKVAVSLIWLSAVFFVLLNITWINGTRTRAVNANFATWYELKNQFYNYLIQ